MPGQIPRSVSNNLNSAGGEPGLEYYRRAREGTTKIRQDGELSCDPVVIQMYSRTRGEQAWPGAGAAGDCPQDGRLRGVASSIEHGALTLRPAMPTTRRISHPAPAARDGCRI